MIMSPRTWIAALAVMSAATTAVHADGRNEVRAVTFDEDGGVTRIHVRGEETPTFTVYKLERPTRVVIDLPQARLAEALRGHETAATFTPGTWAVSTIAAQQLDDGAVRVIVTMARPGRYDVKTDGTEVIVSVMPRDPAPKLANPAELEAAKRDAEAARAEADRLRKLAADQQVKAEAAQRAAATASSADADRAKQDAARAKAEAEQARGAGNGRGGAGRQDARRGRFPREGGSGAGARRDGEGADRCGAGAERGREGTERRSGGAE